MPSGPTMKLPLRKSPCTSAGRARRGGRVLVEPAQAELERGVRLAERVEQGAVLVDLRRGAVHRAAAGSVAGSTAWIARRDRRRTARRGAGAPSANSASRRMRRGIVSPSMRSITKPAPSPSSAVEQRADARARARRPRSAAASTAYSVARSVGAAVAAGIAAQDQRDGPAPSASTASSAHVSRDAPPEQRRSPSTSTGSPTKRPIDPGQGDEIGSVAGHGGDAIGRRAAVRWPERLSAPFLHRPWRTPPRPVLILWRVTSTSQAARSSPASGRPRPGAGSP